MSIKTAQSDEVNKYIGPKPSAVVATETVFDRNSEVYSKKAVLFNDSTITLRSYNLNDNDSCKPKVCEKEEVKEQELEESEKESIQESVGDDCGEPFREQYLKIDFTPTDSPNDDDYNVEKCIQFWHFLNTHTELHHLKVTPQVSFEGSEQSDSWSSTTSSVEETDSSKSAIKWMKKTDLMVPAFNTKQPATYCDDNQGFGWKESEALLPGQGVKAEKSRDLRPVKSRKFKEIRKPSSPKVQRLMAEMKAWDPQHPKSFDPPSHPPNLNTAQQIRHGKYYWDLDMK